MSEEYKDEENIIQEESLNMKLHDEIDLGDFVIIRVYKGWIYNFYVSFHIVQSVFVPENMFYMG